jgi:hypothetical protein
VVATEIAVFGTIFQHVVDCSHHRGGHGANRFLRAVPAAQAVELRLVVAVLLASGRSAALHHRLLEQGDPLRRRDDLRLPVLS